MLDCLLLSIASVIAFVQAVGASMSINFYSFSVFGHLPNSGQLLPGFSWPLFSARVISLDYTLFGGYLGEW